MKSGSGKTGKMILALLSIALIVGFAGYKIFRKARFIARIASAVGEATAGDSEDHNDANLWADDCVVLIIQHTNETEVAQACVDYWQDRLKKRLTITSNPELYAEEGQMGVVPVRNGCVQIVGSLQWPKPEFEALTKYLSERFKTLAIETRDVDFSGAYVFGVFEQGEKKFRAEMEIKGRTLTEMEEVVTTEGQDWALAHGFKPGEDGFKEFSLSDGDQITKHLGIKIANWQESDHFLILKDESAPAHQP